MKRSPGCICGLGRYRLDRLLVAVVQSWLNSRLAAGDSIAKVHIMRTVLGAALTQAMREELVSRNVASCEQRAVMGCTRRSSCCSPTASAAARSSG